MALQTTFRRWGLRARELARYVEHAPAIEPLYAEILACGTRDDLARVVRTHRGRGVFHGSKYRHYAWYLRENLSRAMELGLHEPPTRRVLDLGCGPGYFLAACAELGHEAVGVDLPGFEFFTELRAALGVTTIDHRIVPADFDGLPSSARFDLVTAFSVTFDRDDDGMPWGTAQWARFLGALDRRLTEDGAALLRFNCADPDQPSGPNALESAVLSDAVFLAERRDLRSIELRRMALEGAAV